MGPIVVFHMRILVVVVEEDSAALAIKRILLRRRFQINHLDLVGMEVEEITIGNLVSSLQRASVGTVPTASSLMMVVVVLITKIHSEEVVDGDQPPQQQARLAEVGQHLEEELLLPLSDLLSRVVIPLEDRGDKKFSLI